jgi:large subunit ribosomal protein L15
VDNHVLVEAGLISNAYTTVKLLQRGELTKKVTVKLQKASQTSIDAVQAAGGSFEVTTRLQRPKISDKKTK